MIKSLISLILGVTMSLASAESIVAVYDLQGPLSESGMAEPSLLAMDLEADRPLTFFDITRSLRQAAADPEVGALVLDIDDADLQLTQLQEIRSHLLTARQAGKDVWLYSDAYNNSTALLGSAANHFVLMPEAEVSFAGISAESIYLKGMLDKAGIAADVIHIGDFKCIGEELYRSGPSEFAEKQTQELIGGIFDQITGDVAKGRQVPREKVLSLIERGTFTAEEAKEAGLVDDLKYRTDFNKELKEKYADADIDDEYSLPDLDGPEIEGIFDLFKLMMNSGKESRADEDYVAVVALEGAITSQSIAPVRAEILKLLKDKHAKALVLRVNSPGGSALASEVLWEATDEWMAADRPFAVSMGEVAASGGYYVSSGAERIFAEPGTLTGSIGVVGMKFVMAGAMEKLGITTHTVQRGEHADAMSMSKPFSPEESKLVRESMLDVYGTFKKHITDGRGDRLNGELESMAGGRVFTGTKALELGLIDELGGLSDAIAWAAEKAEIEDGNAQLKPEPTSMLEGLFSEPEKMTDGEIVRMGSSASPTTAAIRNVIREAGLSALPLPAHASIERAFQRLDSISESKIQLIGPDLQLRW
ncbi:signal peptide peptidase SppA [Haloferula chungangensis]|uniref:Signal peptide peptidase SppA n=1 Tax=Haloferula chungangensis TaxID=1048331 RepID=A0ABW2L9K9_9BACT